MARGVGFTISEDDFLIKNCEIKTAAELFQLHKQLREQRFWSRRSSKSLARRIERLRQLNKVDKRNEETRRKAYYGRNKAIRGE